MNTVLEVKEDGQIWLWPDRPVEPTSPVRHMVVETQEEYEKALASAERNLVSNQEVAISVLETHFKSKGMRLLKLIQGIYPIPDLKWEVVAKPVQIGFEKWDQMKVAVISLPEPDKEKRKKLLIEMMQEDEKNGMYEDSAKNAQSDNELIAGFMGVDVRNGWNPAQSYIPAYDKDWNLLMDVVAKIAEYRIAYPKETGWVCDCKIVVIRKYLYREVVNFIKWYNQQSK